MADTSTRIFRASLRGRLYRDLELPSGASLEDLAAAIVGAFGFDFDHAFGFYGSLGYRYHDAEERYELFADLGLGKVHLDGYSFHYEDLAGEANAHLPRFLARPPLPRHRAPE